MKEKTYYDSEWVKQMRKKYLFLIAPDLIIKNTLLTPESFWEKPKLQEQNRSEHTRQEFEDARQAAINILEEILSDF